MFHITLGEAYIGAATITGAAAAYVGHRQKRTTDEVVSSKDILLAMRADLVDLRDALQSHTADDAANFREIRESFRPKRRWSLAGLALLLKLFL